MKIKKVSVVDQVSEALKDNILNHTWEPGDKLPSEGDLADTFGVNRLSVRMALQKLNTLGLLETRVGDGTYVRKFSMAPYMNEIADIYMDEKHLNDVRELRNLLEGEAMRIAVSSSTEEEREDIIWHEIRNAYRTRRILTGKLGGIEQTDSKKTIAIVDYKGFRIIIPLKEMMIQLPRTSTEQEYSELMLRQNKILNNMLGADIDFIVRGIDSKTFSVVASRREAMLRKRQLFYLDTDSSGTYRIYEGRIVQSRVIAVAEKVIRVEIFGVETSIMARDLAWDWIGDAHERFSVGDEVLVRVQKVRRESLEDISIRVDVKSISQNTSQDNLQKCRVQSKYMGKVTDVHKGVVYIRLSNGVNAIAHSCYDYRTPGKKDDVSFAVTRLDVERGVAVGIITRIIRQNL